MHNFRIGDKVKCVVDMVFLRPPWSQFQMASPLMGEIYTIAGDTGPRAEMGVDPLVKLVEMSGSWRQDSFELVEEKTLVEDNLALLLVKQDQHQDYSDPDSSFMVGYNTACDDIFHIFGYKIVNTPRLEKI